MVGVVIVTYADRKELLIRVISKLLIEELVTAIYLVGNNTPYSLEEFVKSFDNSKIQYYSFNKNTGSANGYKFGIRQLENNEAIKYLWLLDDDNLPGNKLPELLINYWRENKVPTDQDALMCLRIDRPYLVQVSHGKSVKYYFPKIDAFLGFHILRIHEFFIKRLSKSINQDKKKNVIIPCAPYGGLFFHKNLIKKIGYPDERFFVYADDIEYTYRITNSGGKIILISDAIVDDLEKTWINKTKHGVFHSRYLEHDDFRSYFSIRNTVYLQNKFLLKNKFIYALNQWFYIKYIFLLAVFKNRLPQYKKFRKAVADAFSENFDNSYFYDK